MTLQFSRKNTGVALAELMISSSILLVICLVFVTSIIAVQRNFQASEHYAKSQAAQLRILDYMALDLRRSLSVTARADGGLDLTIPDYYVSATDGSARSFTVVGGRVRYGPTNIPVSYYKRGTVIYRSYNGKETALATEVQDFNLSTEFSKNAVGVTITFQPKFRMSGDKASVRNGTVCFGKTLLRNRLSS